MYRWWTEASTVYQKQGEVFNLKSGKPIWSDSHQVKFRGSMSEEVDWRGGRLIKYLIRSAQIAHLTCVCRQIWWRCWRNKQILWSNNVHCVMLVHWCKPDRTKIWCATHEAAIFFSRTKSLESKGYHHVLLLPESFGPIFTAYSGHFKKVVPVKNRG